MSASKFQLTPTRAAIFAKFCNLLIFLTIGCFFSLIGSIYFSYGAFQAKSSAEFADRSQRKIVENTAGLAQTRMAARHLAHRSFLLHIEEDETSKEHSWALAQFGSQGYPLANYIVWDLHRKAEATRMEVSKRLPDRSDQLQSKLADLSASALALSTRLGEQRGRFDALSYNESDGLYDQVYDLSDELASNLKTAADEYENLRHRSSSTASTIVWVVFFAQLIIFLISSAYDVAAERQRHV